MTGYSHIVIGAGAIGSAAAYRLSQRPRTRVLVIEQFDLINTLGSSGDHSRIIRHSYHDPAYTRLTHAMFASWQEIEERSGLEIYRKTGGLDIAVNEPEARRELDGYRRTLDDEGIAYENLTADELRRRYPQWRVEDDMTGMYQEAGGLIDIRRSVSAHTSLALAAGVEFLSNTRVTGIDVRPSSVTVRTTEGEFEAGALVVAAASWLEELMPDLGLEFALTLSQEQVAYFASPRLQDFTPGRFPIWIFHGAETFYGFPVYGEAGVKIARDMRGAFIRSDERVHCADDTESALLQEFLERYLPSAVGPVLTAKTCLYDMPADRDFVLDVLPHAPHVALFSGAGHAGKFAAVAGEILADLVTAGDTVHDISRFSLRRPAITDPQFEPTFRLTALSE